MKRVTIIVMDSVGAGELPDAREYGDEGSNTLANVAKEVKGLKLPNLERLGLGNIIEIDGVRPQKSPLASYGKMAEVSKGKDTTTGHWEISGLIMKNGFPVYPDGFPKEIIDEFEKRIGTKILGNYPASGTEIINKLGQQHVITGYPIVYTSADSVFQIAAHEEIIPLKRLYEICVTAREILQGEHAVARVIARPFIGTEMNFKRTSARRDFSLEPPGETILDVLSLSGYEVKAVGKIEDIFMGRGITESNHATGNTACQTTILDFLKQEFEGLIFANLVDFDMLYGHRNDPEGYAKALMSLDSWIPEFLNSLQTDDIAIITADHGCDPTTVGTDHSREYVPLLVYGKNVKGGINLGIRNSFSDIAASVSELFGTQNPGPGYSFLSKIINS
ncbi:MAG: phosphopentomutase [Eubacteriales bacterium]|nr:phosphopentomutase [Eubacteriales bacterium]